MNDIDWEHVAEEIEDVGISELNAVQSYLEQILAHLLKLRGWPDLGADRHWRAEIVALQSNAERRFAPTMRQRIPLSKIYSRALRQISLTTYGDEPCDPPPAVCPVTLDQLLNDPCEALEAAFLDPV